MIIEVNVSIESLKKYQKFYYWIKPKKCPRCEKKLWGHGFVLRYFNSCPEGIFIKRWRCSHCFIVLLCRPKEYWRRYQETTSHIFEALLYRVKNLKWPPWTTRQRGGHWLKKIILNAKINLLIKDNILKTISFYRDKNLDIFN